MAVRPFEPGDLEAWIAMRRQLWPEESLEELAGDSGEVHEGRLGIFVWEEDGGLHGFAEVSMRSVADDCRTSPVGYLEGWWVEEGYRRRGVGRALVEASIEWASRRGAVEFASDAHADNEVSKVAHAALGFEMNPRPVVKFRRDICSESEAADVSGGVTLRPVTEENVRALCLLDVAPHQQGFVAPNAVSLAQALVSEKAWVRAVYAGEEPVGFAMLSDDDEQPRYYLWRFMIDQRYQGHGFGKRAMDLVADYVRSRPGADRLYLSYVRAPGGPEAFYKSLGFVDTGEVHEGEVEAALDL